MLSDAAFMRAREATGGGPSMQPLNFSDFTGALNALAELAFPGLPQGTPLQPLLLERIATAVRRAAPQPAAVPGSDVVGAIVPAGNEAMSWEDLEQVRQQTGVHNPNWLS